MPNYTEAERFFYEAWRKKVPLKEVRARLETIQQNRTADCRRVQAVHDQYDVSFREMKEVVDIWVYSRHPLHPVHSTIWVRRAFIALQGELWLIKGKYLAEFGGTLPPELEDEAEELAGVGEHEPTTDEISSWCDRYATTRDDKVIRIRVQPAHVSGVKRSNWYRAMPPTMELLGAIGGLRMIAAVNALALSEEDVPTIIEFFQNRHVAGRTPIPYKPRPAESEPAPPPSREQRPDCETFGISDVYDDDGTLRLHRKRENR
jgi:hypothetical protein